MSESPLVSAAGRLSPEAAGRLISELYDRHGRAVLGLCRLMLRDAADAEDAMQSAFLAAHKAVLRGSVPRNGGAWITEIARNECRARIRERMKAPLAARDEALHAIPAPGGDPAHATADERVQKALAALPERQRHAVVLHDVFGLRAREVAAALGLSLTAVEALIFRGRRQLRVRLRPVAGALTLPVGLRDTLAAVIPGFADGGTTAAGVAAGGGIGGGILAKLAAAPVAAKVSAAAVAVTAAGSAVALEAGRERPVPPAAVAATTRPAPAPAPKTVSRTGSGAGVGAAHDQEAQGAGQSSRVRGSDDHRDGERAGDAGATPGRPDSSGPGGGRRDSDDERGDSRSAAKGDLDASRDDGEPRREEASTAATTRTEDDDDSGHAVSSSGSSAERELDDDHEHREEADTPSTGSDSSGSSESSGSLESGPSPSASGEDDELDD